MIQDFYIFIFIFCQHYSIMSTEEKPKGNQNKQTRGKNGTRDHLNLQLRFAFQAFFEQIWFLMQTNKGYLKKNQKQHIQNIREQCHFEGREQNKAEAVWK